MDRNSELIADIIVTGEIPVGIRMLGDGDNGLGQILVKIGMEAYNSGQYKGMTKPEVLAQMKRNSDAVVLLDGKPVRTDVDPKLWPL
jgi:hypothetical protein